MGESVLKRLLGGFRKEPANETVIVDSRLRLATQGASDPAEKAVSPVIEPLPQDAPASATPQLVDPLPVAPPVDSDEEMLVDIKGFVMSRHAALEIEGIAKGSSDCVDVRHDRADEVGYRLTVTLAMKPDPRRIDEAVEAMQAICSQLGGKAEGFALRQERNAA
jgi:hypothetical protein